MGGTVHSDASDFLLTASDELEGPLVSGPILGVLGEELVDGMPRTVAAIFSRGKLLPSGLAVPPAALDAECEVVGLGGGGARIEGVHL